MSIARDVDPVFTSGQCGGRIPARQSPTHRIDLGLAGHARTVSAASMPSFATAAFTAVRSDG
ncbi:hypothetical protein ACFRCI_42405 [Streptomyces sp. NPDC056638]|uniref:hypothetical protein n=1 Tax=Streptomyces sp. NPDC056638 TaxID=3345887 RepID=UPI0036C16DCB